MKSYSDAPKEPVLEVMNYRDPPDPLLPLAEAVAAAEVRLRNHAYGQVSLDPAKRAQQILRTAQLRAEYDRAQAALHNALRPIGK